MTVDAGAVRLAWAPVPADVPRREVAWRLLRELAGDVELRNPCPFCGGPHGPVTLPASPWVASVAYAAGYAVVAVAPAAVAVALGVDAVADAGIRLDRVLGPAATPRDWARMEAALKADGRGLRVDPGAVRVRDTDAGWSADLPGGGKLIGWDLPGPDGVVVAAAIRRRRSGASSAARR